MEKGFKEIPIQENLEDWKILTENVRTTLPEKVDPDTMVKALEGAKRQLAMQIGTAIVDHYGMASAGTLYEDLADGTWVKRTYGIRVPVGKFDVVFQEALSSKEVED